MATDHVRVSARGPGQHIGDVSPEILVEILSYLKLGDLARAAQVCKHWKQLTYTHRLWRNAVLYPCKFAPDMLPGLREREVRKVNICTWRNVRAILEGLPNLESVRLAYHSPTGDRSSGRDPGILCAGLAANVSSLKALHLNFHLIADHLALNGHRLGHTVPLLLNLEVLVLYRADCVTHRPGLAAILSGLRKLQRLAIFGLDARVSLRPDPARGLPSPYHSDSLQYLNLQRIGPWGGFDHGSFQAVSQAFPNLKELVLKWIVGDATDEDCLWHLRAMPNLRKLTVDLNYKFLRNPAALTELEEGCSVVVSAFSGALWEGERSPEADVYWPV